MHDTSRAPPADAPKVAKPRTRNTSATNSLTSAIRDMLTYEGCTIWRHNNAGVYDNQLQCYRANSSRKGLPDTLGFYRRTGHFVAVEVKYGKDTLTPEQRDFLADVKAAGGFACEGRSLEQVRREFNEWKLGITKSTKT
ncbi:VRR-NUC domain-containing protein [Hymenobacter sp. YC55]|nr:VRR-NUC domain-containing protein [Hymenobacter sp. YC55]